MHRVRWVRTQHSLQDQQASTGSDPSAQSPEKFPFRPIVYLPFYLIPRPPIFLTLYLVARLVACRPRQIFLGHLRTQGTCSPTSPRLKSSHSNRPHRHGLFRCYFWCWSRGISHQAGCTSSPDTLQWIWIRFWLRCFSPIIRVTQGFEWKAQTEWTQDVEREWPYQREAPKRLRYEGTQEGQVVPLLVGDGPKVDVRNAKAKE